MKCSPDVYLSPTQMVESEVKEEFVKEMATTLDWSALCKAASEVSALRNTANRSSHGSSKHSWNRVFHGERDACPKRIMPDWP